MRLRSLRIHDWGPFHDVTFAPQGRVALLYGPHGAGKTTLPDALKWLITGRASGVSDKVDAQRELIRQGATEGLVEGEFVTENGATIAIRRKVGPRGQGVLGYAQDADRMAKMAAEVFCHAESLLDENPDRQRSVLMTAVEPRLSILDVADHVPLDELPEAPGVPWPMKPGQEPGTIGRAEVELLYERCFAERTVVGRQLREIKVPPEVTWGTPRRPDVVKLEADLEALKTEERRATHEAGAEVGRRRALNKRLREAMGRQKKLEGVRTFLFPTEQDYQNEIARLEKELEVLETMRRDWEEAAGAVREERRRLEDEALRLTASAKALEGMEAHCTVCQQALPPAAKQHAMSALTARRQEVDARLRGLEAPAEPPSLGPTHDRLKAVKKDMDVMASHGAALLAVAQEIATLVEEGGKVSEAMETALTDPAPPPELVALRARVTRGERIVKLAKDLLKQEQERGAAILKQTQLRVRSERLEKAVKYLGPKGALDQALSASLAGVLERANAFLAPWNWTLLVEMDPFRLRLADGRPVVRLSKSERWRVSTALALACAIGCGWKTVVLDGADILLPAARRLLTQVIGAALDHGLTVLVTIAAEEPPKGVVPEGVERYWVSTGAIAVIE